MPTNLIQIKAFLGKYYQDLAYVTSQSKYNKAGLNKFFEQRFVIQDNKAQMIIDPALTGLSAIICGNEIHVSQDLYDHEHINITNSLETPNNNNPKSLYSPEIFSTMAYLICQNHTMFNIVGETDEPIYIKYKSDYETFYNSVIIVNVAEGIDVEVVEEFESLCAVNSVINYILQPSSRLAVTTFYKNHLSAMSFCFRNVIAQENSKFNHMLFGRGSANVVDETKVHTHEKSCVELLGCINPGKQEFHVITGISPVSDDYTLMLDHRHVVAGSGKTTFTPVIIGHLPSNSFTNITSIMLDQYKEEIRAEKAKDFISVLIDRSTLERSVGVERFYSNKSKFLQFQ